MLHPREVITQKVVEILKAANTAAGQAVYPNRALPLTAKKLPAILVYSLAEKVDPESRVGGPRELSRELDLVIDGLVLAADLDEEVDTTLNALALQIETAMHADSSLGGLVDDSILSETGIEFDPDGEHLAGVVSLSYSVLYRSLAITPDDDLDDFLVANVKIPHTGATEDSLPPYSEDNVVVQEIES